MRQFEELLAQQTLPLFLHRLCQYIVPDRQWSYEF